MFYSKVIDVNEICILSDKLLVSLVVSDTILKTDSIKLWAMT
jgi:hypothetical protein